MAGRHEVEKTPWIDKREKCILPVNPVSPGKKEGRRGSRDHVEPAGPQARTELPISAKEAYGSTPSGEKRSQSSS
jgi:hypothetical protein